MPKSFLQNIFGHRRAERAFPDSLELSATLDITSASAGAGSSPAKFSMVANTGKPMVVGDFDDPVLIVLSGARFEKSTTPVIMDHDTSLRLGHTTKQTIDESGIKAEGVVSSTTEVAEGFAKDAKAGFPFQVSIGSKIEKAVYIPEGERVQANGQEWEGPLLLVQETTIKELSVTVLGADSETSIQIAASRKGKDTMPQSEQELQANRRLQATEELRVDRIRAAAQQYQHDEFSGDIFKGIRSVAEAKAHAIETGMAPAELELALVRAARPGPVLAGVSDRAGRGGVGSAAAGKTIEAALLLKAGYQTIAEKAYGSQICEAAHPLRSASFMDLCRYSLTSSGREAPTNRHDLIQAAFSTVAMPNALGGSMDKLAGVLFLEAPSPWRAFATVRDLGNFRTHTVINPQHSGSLEKTGETGEVKHGYLGESTSNIKLDTYAKTISFSRQAAYADDLTLLDDIPQVFVSQANKRLNDLVASVLLGGIGSHWTTPRGNLISDALGVDGLSAAIAAMKRQVDSEGNNEDIIPSCLLTTATDEATGLQVLRSVEVARDTTDRDNQPTGNPLFSRLQLASEARLENSAKFGEAATSEHWWLFGSQQSNAVFVGFLDGNQAPRIDFFGIDKNANTLNLQWRVFIDFGAALGYPGSSVYSIGDDSSL
ncbi:HK97 family phage prohead protease [Blastopirellula sp. J2-11]|uniref:phage major capsid protein n=1 Tax=Blastopirellula sp. J2-11 TaxID=2943192 RepID=UPI0021C7D956|nr:HK97 family phage prohead protease [Blastopirellula sp. J2-11]UUO06940.1 HK97 family phage prohead protease [Blastopirellula sp. J2-11]